MQGLKRATQAIRRHLTETGLVQEASIMVSRPDDFLQDKKNFYPAIHIDYIGGTGSDQILTVNFTILVVDIVDEELRNEEDVFNSTLSISARIIAELQKAEPSELYHLNEDATLDRLYEKGEQNYAGWALQFPLIIQNTSHAN